MISYINPNYIKASRLIMLSVIINICGFILLGSFTDTDNLYYIAAQVMIVGGLAFFIRKQHNWAKWLFLLVALYSVYTLIGMLWAIVIMLPIVGVLAYVI